MMAGLVDAAMDYLTLKTIHQTAVALSITGFCARGLGALFDAAWIRGRLARSLPHAVDSVLLLSALGLAWTLRLNPLLPPWLLAKIIGLLVYITLGIVALQPHRSRPVRAMAFLGALASVGYIVAVAISKSPRGYLAWL